MQINSTKDFARSRADVLAKFRSAERLEDVLASMNIATQRRAGPPAPEWACSIHWREAPRHFTARMAETATDETMALTVNSDLADAVITMDFYDLPDGGCRVISCADVTAHTVLVRLALQSLRLVRGKGESRLTRLVTAIGRP